MEITMRRLQKYFAKRKIKKFIILMSRTLAKDYGRSSEYTEGQVKTALKKLGYAKEFEEIAITIFCNEEMAKAFGVDEALIRKYRGYLLEPDTNISYGGHSGGSGGDGFGGGDAGGGGD